MNIKYFLPLLFVLFTVQLNAQVSDDEVLFSVAGEPVYVSEFLRVYNKNLDLVQNESQRDVDEYLKLFTTYKLKLKEAQALELDKKESYKKELGNYKKQLANSFIRDSKVTDALIEEAYQRISYDIKADHILIKVATNANPKDTITAYNQILKLRDRALSEGFDKVRKEVHNGSTVFGEALGYFTGFKMVYKFENAAFNTPVGEISMPFRTRFGYHIVNVLDKRKSRGERTVAHIMTVEKKGDSLYNPEERIQEVYNKLKQGEDFAALAKQFSDDKNSAPRGGKLAPFSSGQIRAQKFESVAFGLVNEGDVAAPFKSAYGWHIIKLIKKKLIPPFEDIKSELEGKVKRDDRSKLIDEALYSSLKKQYNVDENPEAIIYFQSILSETYFKRSWKLPENFRSSEHLFNIGDRPFTYQDFGTYLIQKQNGRVIKKPIPVFTKENYEAFVNENLLQHKEANLEEENEEFAHILTEYRDGLLLFDLMESTIWNASKTDSTAIKEYYQTHKSDYKTPKQIDAIVAVSSKQKVLKKVMKLLDNGLETEAIKAQVNSKESTDVIFTTGVMDASEPSLPKQLVFKEGISKIYKHNNAFVLVSIHKVIPQTQKAFNEAKGNVISDYQTYKEEKWVNTLKEKYNIVMNNEVLKKVKSQIKKQ